MEGTVPEKTHQMCRNAAAVLEAAGSGLDKVVKVTVGIPCNVARPSMKPLTARNVKMFFANLDDFKDMNEVYAEYFPQRPARSSLEAKRLPAGVSMEMELIAME